MLSPVTDNYYNIPTRGYDCPPKASEALWVLSGYQTCYGAATSRTLAIYEVHTATFASLLLLNLSYPLLRITLILSAVRDNSGLSVVDKINNFQHKVGL